MVHTAASQQGTRPKPRYPSRHTRSRHRGRQDRWRTSQRRPRRDWHERRNGVHDDVHDVLVRNSEEYIVSCGDGLYRTRDGGRYWTRVKYHGRGGPWLRRGLWHEASGTTDGEFNSARARLWRGSRGTSNTRTHRKCHRNRGCLLLPWRVYPWASAPSRGRDTGPASFGIRSVPT